MQRPPSSSRHSVLRWLIFGLVLAGGIGLPFILPPPYSTILVGVGIAGSILLALRPSGTTARTEFITTTQDWRARLPSRTFFLRFLTLLVCGLMLWSAIIFRPGNIGESGVGLYVGIWGTLILGLALWLARNRGELPPPPSSPPPDKPIRPYPLLIGLTLLILVVFINQMSSPILIMSRDYTNIHIQFALWVSGMIFLVWGLAGGGFSFHSWIQRCIRNTSDLYYGVAVLGITLLALGLRLVNLEYGVRRFIDEFHYMSGVVGVWDLKQIHLFLPFNPVATFPWIYPYLDWVSVNAFGPSMASLRLANVLVGTLTVPALCFTVRTLFDRKTALIAALLLATFPPHIHFSRIALNNIADPLFAVLAFGFIGRGFQFNRRRDWVYAGAMLGLSQYFYEGGRLLFPPLVIAWLAWISIHYILGHRLGLKLPFAPARSFPWKSLLLFGLVALIIAAPLYLTYIAHGLSLTPRMDQAAARRSEWQSELSHIESLLERIRAPLLLLVQQPDGGWFYGGETALILPCLLPFFLLGVAHAIWRLRVPGMALLLGWIIATALGNTLMKLSVDVPRYVQVFPALVALVAVGIRYTGHLLQTAWTRQSTLRAGRLLGSTGIMALAVIQVVYYFGIHEVAFRPPPKNQHGISDMFFRMIDLPADTHVYIIYPAVIWGSDIYYTQRFWGRQNDLWVHAYFPADFAEKAPTLPHDVRSAFFVTPDDIDTMQIIREYFNPGPAQISLDPNVPLRQQMLLFYAEEKP